MSINRPGDLAALTGLSHLDDPLRVDALRVNETVEENRRLRRLLEGGQFAEPIDEIVFAVTRKKLDEMKQIFLMCEELGIPVGINAGIPGPRVRSRVQHPELLEDVLIGALAGFAYAGHTELLTERLHHVDGVVSTETFFYLEMWKQLYDWGTRE